MSHRKRKFIFWSFVGLFLIISILTSLYATGYKPNLSWPLRLDRLLEKTGLLIVESEPSGAMIYLDDKPQINILKKYFSAGAAYSLTPKKIKNLKPGEYVLKLELPDYWPYEKKIKINPGETLYLKQLALYKKTSPILIKETVAQEIELTNDKKNLILKKDKQIINLITEKEVNITIDLSVKPTMPEVNLNLNQGPHLKNITVIDKWTLIYHTGFEIFFFNLRDNSRTLISRVSDKINGLIWNKNQYLIYSTTKGLNLIDLKNPKVTTELLNSNNLFPPVLDEKNNILYFTGEINSSTGLYKLLIK